MNYSCTRFVVGNGKAYRLYPVGNPKFFGLSDDDACDVEGTNVTCRDVFETSDESRTFVDDVWCGEKLKKKKKIILYLQIAEKKDKTTMTFFLFDSCSSY